jgi:hypothetical protein
MFNNFLWLLCSPEGRHLHAGTPQQGAGMFQDVSFGTRSDSKYILKIAVGELEVIDGL